MAHPPTTACPSQAAFGRPDGAGMARRLPDLQRRRVPFGGQHRSGVPPRPPAVSRLARRAEHSDALDPRPGRLCHLAARPGLGAGHLGPAHRLVAGLLPLLAIGRGDPRQSGGTPRQPETLGAGPQGAQPPAGRSAHGKPPAQRPLLAPRPCAPGTPLRNRLPGVGDPEPAPARPAPRRGLLPLPGQGRQGTHRAARPTRR